MIAHAAPELNEEPKTDEQPKDEGKQADETAVPAGDGNGTDAQQAEETPVKEEDGAKEGDSKQEGHVTIPAGFFRNVLDDAESEHLRDIRAAYVRCKDAKREWKQCKAATKAAKDEYDESLEDLQDVINAGPNRLPLFDQPARKDTPAKYADTQSAAHAGPEPWRDMPLEGNYDLNASILTKLAEATPSIRTVGQLSDLFKNPYPPNKLEDLDGIGPSAAEKILNADAAFWATHPELCRNPPEPETEVEPPAAAEPDDTADPFEEGRQAAFIGAAKTACPYEADSTSASEWSAGYDSECPQAEEEPAAEEADAEAVDPKTKSYEWNQGHHAYIDGIPRKDNPYARGSSQSDDWREGFDHGQQEALDAEPSKKKKAASKP